MAGIIFGLLIDSEGGPGLYASVDAAKKAAVVEIKKTIAEQAVLGESAWDRLGLYVEWYTPVDADYERPTIYEPEGNVVSEDECDYQVWEIMLQGPLVPQIPLPPCPYCPDGHNDPNRKPWSVWVAQPHSLLKPSHLEVAPSDSWHVAETDAEWLREVIRRARTGT